MFHAKLNLICWVLLLGCIKAIDTVPTTNGRGAAEKSQIYDRLMAAAAEIQGAQEAAQKAAIREIKGWATLQQILFPGSLVQTNPGSAVQTNPGSGSAAPPPKAVLPPPKSSPIAVLRKKRQGSKPITLPANYQPLTLPDGYSPILPAYPTNLNGGLGLEVQTPGFSGIDGGFSFPVVRNGFLFPWDFTGNFDYNTANTQFIFGGDLAPVNPLRVPWKAVYPCFFGLCGNAGK